MLLHPSYLSTNISLILWFLNQINALEIQGSPAKPKETPKGAITFASPIALLTRRRTATIYIESWHRIALHTVVSNTITDLCWKRFKLTSTIIKLTMHSTNIYILSCLIIQEWLRMIKNIRKHTKEHGNSRGIMSSEQTFSLTIKRLINSCLV